MSNVSKSRKGDLRAYEGARTADAELIAWHRATERAFAEAMEEFVKKGMALKAIRDKKTYRTVDGYETFEAYCKARWDVGKAQASQLITASELRQSLPKFTAGEQEWTERTVRELKRLDSPTKANAVAARVIKQVEDSDGKVTLTAALVRKHVDKALGVNRKAKKRKAPTFEEVIARYVGEVSGMAAVIEEVPEDALLLFGRMQPGLAKDLAEAIERLSKVWEVTRPAPVTGPRLVEVMR